MCSTKLHFDTTLLLHKSHLKEGSLSIWIAVIWCFKFEICVGKMKFWPGKRCMNIFTSCWMYLCLLLYWNHIQTNIKSSLQMTIFSSSFQNHLLDTKHKINQSIELSTVHVGFWHVLPGKMNLNHLCHNVHIAYFQKTCLFWKIVFLIFQHKSQFHRFYDHLSTKIPAWIALEIIFSTKKLVELLDLWNLNWFHAEYKRYLMLHDSQTHLHVLSINNFSANFLHELSKLWSFLATVNFGITILKVFLAFLRPLWYALITKLRIL